MYSLARNALFLLPPETAHEISLDLIGCGERLGLNQYWGRKVADNPVKVMGLNFPNPVGLAAGLDKNGDYFNGLGGLGFGFVEVGTVTPRPQPGNPKPRLFRLPEHQAIINRMGFNNLGVDHLVERVKRRRYHGVLGINIGKNFDTPVDQAVNDYLICMRQVYNHADYITVNLSSPNTPGLRELQFGESLTWLLRRLKNEQQKLADKYGEYVPLAVKVAPDLTENEVADIARILVKQNVDGVIATNTTVSRAGVENHIHAAEAGGLSGAPLAGKSTEVVAAFSRELDGALPIIGVGGICCGEDAVAKMAAGASLVQLYSGFIYRGPELIRETADAVASAAR
ncbi:MAG: quinone-dependent dihydroorotate dehydrogenase [Porticoccaceae bacterium]|nr:quinone-dependent dihydroorotate dehydrogenase [Pseudomonadales bacterium]MCP5171439.1 quinone-dependent dihydroorotate dehydrogenase [Pseudomonadales bacterium]